MCVGNELFYLRESMNSIQILTDPHFEQLPGIHHAFFTRNGGVSQGIYASLNCAYKKNADDFTNVTENRRRAMMHLNRDPKTLVTLNDIHSEKVVIVDKPWPINKLPAADGMVTTQSDITLGQLNADCPLVLFADPIARVIGSAHAGWQGAYKGIIEATVQTMLSVGASINDIHAVMGPSIFQQSYEVGSEFIDRFYVQNIANNKYFISSAKSGHALFDLRGYIKDKLINLDVKYIFEIAKDTYQDESHFFSYRRSTHRNEREFGNQLACIFLTNPHS